MCFFRNKFLYIIFLSINIIFIDRSIATDPQLWIFNHLNFVKEANNEVTLTLHGRFVEEDGASLYQIQPKYVRNINNYFWAGFNYSYFGVKQNSRNVEDEDIFSNQHRLEFEIQPRFKLTEQIRYSGRNRIEYLMNDDLNYLNHRFRHRSVFQYEGFLDSTLSLITQSELFYDFGAESLNQFRTVPLGLRVKIDNISISLLPSILSLKRRKEENIERWENSFFTSLEFGYDF